MIDKTCKSCGIAKPLNSQNWVICKNCRDGYRGYCRVCANEKHKAIRKRNSVVRFFQDESNPNELKACSKCKNSYPKTKEFFQFSKRDGFYSQCNVCRKDYVPNELARRKRLLRTDEDYRKKLHKRQKAFHHKNRDKQLQKQRQYASRPEIADLNRKRARQWQINNPVRLRANIERRRAWKANAEGFFTDEDINRIMQEQNYKCLYCAYDVSKKYTIDHLIPLSRGGTNWPVNIGIACRPCNTKKGAKTKEEYLNQIGGLKYG